MILFSLDLNNYPFLDNKEEYYFSTLALDWYTLSYIF